MSMLTTAGPTRSAALTTVREYSSSSAASFHPGETRDDSCAEPASDSFSKAAMAGSRPPATLEILITKSRTSVAPGQLHADLTYTHLLACYSLSLRLGATRPRQGHALFIPRLRDGRPMPIPTL